MMDKKGFSDTFSTIVTVVIVLLVLFILSYSLTKGFTNFDVGLNSCPAKGGECMQSCGDYAPILDGNGFCRKELNADNAVCCRVPQVPPSQQSGIGANHKYLTLLVNKDTKVHGSSTTVDVGTPYKIEARLDYSKINDADPAEDPKNRVCSIILKNIDSGETFLLKRGATESANTPIDNDYAYEKFSEEVPEGYVITCRDIENDRIFPRFFRPEMVDQGQTYEVNLIVYKDDVYEAYMSTQDPEERAEKLEAMIFFRENWISHSAIYLKVNKVLEITDVSSTWVSSDDINIRSNDPYLLSGVSVSMVSDQDLNSPSIDQTQSIYRRLQAACSDPGLKYLSSLNRITALKAGSEGFNLGVFDYGRDNQQSVGYVSQSQPITFTQNTARIHLDAATIIEDFYRDDVEKFKSLLNESINSDNLRNYYLCVKASVSKGKAATPTQVIAASPSPLKLDIAPPYITNADDYIQVVYPQPFRSQLDELTRAGLVQPGQRITPYYFQEYPKVKIAKCVDKSGCKNYDYYFAPTTIELSVNTDSLGDGIVATLIGAGINQIYQYMLTRNPLDTVCPLGTSASYRRNTAPEIRFRDKQGIFCIKVVDGAGNYWLTWKPVYNPYDILEKALAETLPNPQDIRPIVG